MSVQSWKRKLSGTQYLYTIFELNITIGHVIGGTPKKYLNNYGNQLVEAAAEALQHAQTANGVHIRDEASYIFRRNELQLAAGCLENVCTMAYIFLEIVRKHDGIPVEQKNRIHRWEDQIGNHVDKACNLIKGVMEYDTGVFKKLSLELPDAR